MRKKERGLSLKQKRWIKNFTDPQSPTFGNESASALASGYRNTISGRENVRKPHIKKKIDEILSKQGYSDDKMFERLIGIIENYDASSKDRTNAIQALRLLWELKGSFPSKKIEEKVEHIGLESKDMLELKKLISAKSVN